MLKRFVPYNDLDAREYVNRGYRRYLTFGDILDRAADANPDKEALVDDTGRLTYARLHEKTDRLAISLMELGIKSQDRVLLQFPNWSEFIYTYFAA
jgi:2,3-dihydroxybenzoate-AMP ligase